MTTLDENVIRDALRDEAQRIKEDALFSAKGHFQAAQLWDKCNMWLGVPATVMAAAAGVTAMAEYTTVASIIAVLVAILSGLLTFLNPSGCSARHLKAGNAYNALRNDASIFHKIKCRNSAPIGTLETLLDDLNLRRNSLNADSPQIPRKAYERARDGIEAGEADYHVDRQDI